MELDVTLRVRGERRDVPGKVRNIGLGGVFVEIPRPHGDGLTVEMMVDLRIAAAPGPGAAVLECEGRIVWAWSDELVPEEGTPRRGFGIAFATLSPAQEAGVRALVEGRPL